MKRNDKKAMKKKRRKRRMKESKRETNTKGEDASWNEQRRQEKEFGKKR